MRGSSSCWHYTAGMSKCTYKLGFVQELDPLGKFASMSNVWSWRATREGQDVPLTQCCTPNGFSTDCLCAKRLSCSS